MKGILHLGLVVVLLGSARADPLPVEEPLSPMRARPEASLSPLRLNVDDLVRVERTARRKRNAGIGLAIPGVVSLVLGLVLIGAGEHQSHLASAASEIAAGAAAGSIGAVLTIPGALLWVRGQDDLDLAAWRRRRLTPKP